MTTLPTITLSADYFVGDSPLWGAEHLDATELGLSAQLRADLAAWSGAFDSITQTDYAFASEEAELAHRVGALQLAARVQRELSDAAVVTCRTGAERITARDRHDGDARRAPVLLITPTSVGGDDELVDQAADEPLVVTAAEAGARPETVAALVELRGRAAGQEGPGATPADIRARTLEVAAALQRDVGVGARVAPWPPSPAG